MRQQIIALASILSGAALMALVVSLQRDPLLWTRASGKSVERLEPAKGPRAEPVAESGPHPSRPVSSHVVDVPEVHITWPKPAPPPRLKHELNELQREPNELAPCSEWRELGPAYVDQGTPQGTLRVRNLC
jgi:hypothetical protein